MPLPRYNFVDVDNVCFYLRFHVPHNNEVSNLLMDIWKNLLVNLYNMMYTSGFQITVFHLIFVLKLQ